jgi:type III restriction enzyme
VRNLERKGFWLPLARNKFYPDFVVELNDGRILVVEYKGKHLITADEAKAKALVGELWERASNGKALFLMAEKEGAGKPTITEQIKGKVG